MPKVEWHGDRLAKEAMQAALKVCSMTAEVVKGIAVDRTPLKDNQLRSSATVTDLKNGSEISFTAPHAVVQHEKQYKHYTHEGTGPNYLRGPLLENEEKFHADVAAAMKAIFG
jgi:hypothetical protein